MDKERITQEMHELEDIIGYKFKKIKHLEQAMKATRLPRRGCDGNRNQELSNAALAFVGDAILKAIISDYLFKNSDEDSKRKGDLTEERKGLENNKLWHEIIMQEGVINYAYNDDYFYKDDNIPEHKKVPSSKHDPYIEAIAGAIYYDAGFKKVKEWFEKWLLPCIKNTKSETAFFATRIDNFLPL